MTVYDNWVEYADGRQEKLVLPVEYDIGTKITVVRKSNGSVVVALAE